MIWTVGVRSREGLQMAADRAMKPMIDATDSTPPDRMKVIDGRPLAWPPRARPRPILLAAWIEPNC